MNFIRVLQTKLILLPSGKEQYYLFWICCWGQQHSKLWQRKSALHGKRVFPFSLRLWNRSGSPVCGKIWGFSRETHFLTHFFTTSLYSLLPMPGHSNLLRPDFVEPCGTKVQVDILYAWPLMPLVEPVKNVWSTTTSTLHNTTSPQKFSLIQPFPPNLCSSNMVF